MTKTIAALSLAVGLGLLCSQGASALPADATAIAQAAAATSAVQQAQYSEHRTRHGLVKCYRDFVIGRYGCHRYTYW
jgi:hypothetical protein